jgi:hypothetical protein
MAARPLPRFAQARANIKINFFCDITLALAKLGRGWPRINAGRVRAFTLLKITGMVSLKESGLFALDPFAGIIQIRFIGCNLRLLSEPPHGNSTIQKRG